MGFLLLRQSILGRYKFDLLTDHGNFFLDKEELRQQDLSITAYMTD